MEAGRKIQNRTHRITETNKEFTREREKNKIQTQRGAGKIGTESDRENERARERERERESEGAGYNNQYLFPQSTNVIIGSEYKEKMPFHKKN